MKRPGCEPPLVSLLALILAPAWSGTAAGSARLPASAAVYSFRIEQSWLAMPDGVRLSVTCFMPAARTPGERFPVLLELLPYRKDDMFYRRDYPLYSYFARRGYAMAKVDVRGTGSSEGVLPDREYSEQELDDAVEIIRQLARQPWSSGRIGMWGISWGGFNAIQAAMRRPPELRAILAVDASDDLFHDDVHYIDGAYHADEYELSIDNDNGLPDSIEYRVDDAYFRDRFDRYPWFLTYLKQQQDGDFWRDNSLRFRYDAIQVPVYLIGGLLDGYRDSVPRMLENMNVPMKAEIGPWNHAWPDNGEPGPNYEWRQELVRWWDYWLKGKDTGIMDEPRFAVFVRAGHAPDAFLKETPGHWRYEDWPIRRTTWSRLYPSAARSLGKAAPEKTVEKLKYVPSSGVQAGFWWGESTGDMRPDDAGCLVYDSEPVAGSMEIIGFPRVKLRAAASAQLAHWVVRLEDVQPDGRVSLVTGAVLNGAQRESRLEPKPLAPGEFYPLDIELHFTTWTFQPGHRIRVAVGNAQFPMIWPTPQPMDTLLELGPATFVELPVIPSEPRARPAFLSPEPREERPDAEELPGGAWPREYECTRDLAGSTTTVTWAGEDLFKIRDRRYRLFERTTYKTNDTRPAESTFVGEAGHWIELPGRSLDLRTLIEVHSDEANFHVVFSRTLYQNGARVREKTWDETIPRRLQ
ncbi:MAG: CocE/NonD family hydrolase [Acidobacteriota bacterium]